MCVVCVLCHVCAWCLIVVPLPPGENPFAVKINNNNVRSFRAADCDTDHYLVVTKLKERLAVSKQTTHSVHMERLNLRKLNEAEVK
jgi:hypothetical protein